MAEKYLTHNPARAIDETIASLKADKVVVVTDENVNRAVLPRLSGSQTLKEAEVIVLKPGEDEKNLATVTRIWDKLEETGATRQSVVLNIGGGVVTDMGGFAAATFKRGLRTVNFPTTVLGAVDAATGGKTGINYRGLKNEIGVFHMPTKVIVSAMPFESLEREDLLSGYAEMVKTALISDREFYESLLDLEKVMTDPLIFGRYVEKCVLIKDEVVAQDPREQGLRKILNFGHTAGHAIESLRLEKGVPVSHGKAVAHGMLVALILSNKLLGLDAGEVEKYARFLRRYYGESLIATEDTAGLIDKMNSDKKNSRHGQPSFTLLKEIGEPVFDCHPSLSEIKEAIEKSVVM